MEQFRFDSGSGVGAKWGRVQIGPYHGTLLSDSTTPSLTLYCVDFVHGIGGGNLVDVNTVNLGNDDADLSTTRLKNDPDLNGGVPIDSRLMQYRQAAFLAAMFDSYADLGGFAFDSNQDGVEDATFGSFMPNPYGNVDLRRNVWSGLHAAIWSLMTPGFPEGPLAGHASLIEDVNLALGMAQAFLDVA